MQFVSERSQKLQNDYNRLLYVTACWDICTECLLKASSVGDGLYACTCVKLKTSENMKFFKFPSNPAPTLGQKSEFNYTNKN